MKSLIKKLTVAICIASASITLITATVSASDQVRPLPGTEVTETTNTSSGEQSVSSAPSNNTQSMAQASVSATSNKKYLTNLGAFGWFALSVLVNFILSCWIGNKYYNLAMRSSQNSNEIRALRKDIEEKFASTLTDIEDRAVDVMNRNENYSRTDEGISMPEHRVHVEMNEEERETMRKWDKTRITQRVIAKEEVGDDEPSYEPSYELPKREYQPTRRSSGIEFEDDDEYDDEDYDDYRDKRPMRKSDRREKPVKTIAKATNKAKDFLSNVFPFEDK